MRQSSAEEVFPRILFFFVLAHFSHHLLTSLPIPLSPMIRSDFALDYTQAGLVISAFNLSYGIGQLPAGWLADRLGPRLMMAIGICGVALAGFLVSLSHSFFMLIIFLALMGIMGGGYHPAAPPMISAAVEKIYQGRALGLHMIGGGASFFLAPLIATAIAAYFGWRGSFLGLALPTLAYGLYFYLILKKRGLGNPVKKERSKKASEQKTSPGQMRTLGIFIFLSTFTAAVLFAAMSFIPLFLVDQVGFSKEKAGAFFAFIYSAGLWVSPLGGYLSDRWGAIPVLLFVLFLAGPVIYLLNFVSSWGGVGILLLLIGIIIYVRMPVSEAYIIAKTPEHSKSAILGLYFFSSMEGGGILTPLMGYLIDNLGFYYSFTIAGIILGGVTLLGAILLWRRERD